MVSWSFDLHELALVSYVVLCPCYTVSHTVGSVDVFVLACTPDTAVAYKLCGQCRLGGS